MNSNFVYFKKKKKKSRLRHIAQGLDEARIRVKEYEKEPLIYFCEIVDFLLLIILL